MQEIKVTIIITIMLTIAFLVSFLTTPYLYTILIIFLLYDYFSLLGGVLNWLNTKIDKNFKETGIHRRMIAADAKLVIVSGFVTLWLTYWQFTTDYSAFKCITGSPDILIFTIPEYLSWLFSGKVSIGDIPFTFAHPYNYFIPISMLVAIIKLCFLCQLTHSIHHIILDEKLTGTARSSYPALTNLVYKGMRWARK